MKLSIGIEARIGDSEYKISAGNWSWHFSGGNYKLAMGSVIYVFWCGPFRLSITPTKSAKII